MKAELRAQLEAAHKEINRLKEEDLKAWIPVIQTTARIEALQEALDRELTGEEE